MVFVHIRPDWWLPDGAATEESVYLNRRQILARLGLGIGGLSLLGLGACETDLEASGLQDRGKEGGQEPASQPASEPAAGEDGPSAFAPGTPMKAPRNDKVPDPRRAITPEKLATHYNNFYEFSLDKERVWKLVDRFKTEPWSVEIDGLVEKPGTYTIEDLEKLVPPEERVYRFRCVEAWAMTVPWAGLPLAALLTKLGVKAEARYLAFKTFLRPEQAPNQNPASGYPWPYYEALSVAEARNELAMLATGIYGKRLPKQNGAPIRLVVPWKYGLKNIKSIVKISFVKERPPTFWNAIAPDEYSWASNVEPDVPHPRWSQAKERLLDDGRKVPTLPFNGYAEQVAALYR
ncbi:MAG: protein-methionine-sulfoxide reductase catalytic subunit MsrP [Planctomycetota bacterium]